MSFSSFIAAFSFSAAGADIGHSGMRSSLAQRPMKASACLSGIGLVSMNKRAHHRHNLVVDFARAREISRQPRRRQIVHLARHHVGGCRDDALAAQRHDRHCEPVVARENRQPVAAQAANIGDLIHRARRFLDPDDVANLAQPRERLGRDIRGGAARNVVDDQRQVDRARRSSCSGGKSRPGWACCSRARSAARRRRPSRAPRS